MIYDCIVIGAGASGLMFSNIISKKLNTLVLEKNNSAGKKLLITGNGRCNLTNNLDNKEFLNNINHNKKYLYQTIYKFGPKEVINYFKLPLKNENGKIFPVSNDSSEVLNYLLKHKNTDIKYNNEVIKIEKENNKYILYTKNNIYKTNYLIIATGGSSFKRLGSSGDNIKFSKMLNQKTVPIYPCETSIILKNKYDLAGTSFDNIILKVNKKSFEGNLIFTHNGLSGHSVMSASEHIYLEKTKEIYIDFLPNITQEYIKKDMLENKNNSILNYLSTYFTKKFITFTLEYLNISNDNIKSINLKNIDLLINTLKNYKFSVKSVSDIDKAYVTGGGVDLKDIDTSNFSSKTNHNLFFIGEALDIHGPIGGYNLTLAFSSAYSAASYINENTR